MSVESESRARDRFIDALRVGAVLVVVVGHWTATNVIWDAERIVGENALSVIPEAHLATWLLQVMPLLFFVGGFANARALARHGDHYLAFLRTRLRRLLTPTIAFMVVWLMIGVVAELLPLTEPNIVERAADIAALPFWFLGLYILIVALAPPMLWLHRRLGWWIPAALLVGTAAVDALAYALDFEAAGIFNYAFVWLLPHQLGFFHEEGRLRWVSGWTAGTVATVGLIGLVAATFVGGYPLSMIGVPGEDRWNTDPPSLPLVALTVWLIGLALLMRPPIEAWAGRRPQLLDRVGGVVLSMYLWHVSAVSLAVMVIYPLGFPRVKTGSAGWWLVRPVWIAVLVPFLVLLVYLVRRFEIHPAPQQIPRRVGDAARHVGAGIAVVSLALGILGFGVTGFDRPATQFGGTVLEFSMNPLQNAMHVAVGVGVATSIYASARPAIGGLVASAAYVLLGVAGWTEGLRLLAMNSATARLHVAIGALGLVLMWLALALGRHSHQPLSARQ